MKKITVLILIFLLALSLSTTALAANVEANNGTASTDVQAVYEAGNSGSVVSVEITWENMEFTYKGASEPGWDADTHSYSGTASEAGWKQSDAKINITNHSNVIIQTGISYIPGDGFPDSSMVFTAAAPYIGSAHTTDDGEGTPCTVSIPVIPDGIIPESTTQKTTIGSVTVRVSALTGTDTAQTALDGLNALYQKIYKAGFDPSALSRGAVYFTSKADANTAYAALYSASDLISSGAAEAQVNVALNEAITALYGALTIKQ